MNILFAGSCPKDPHGSDVNEDRWAFDVARGTLALCDGASESFDSSVWAGILADKFVLNPAVTPEWINNALADYVSRHDWDGMSWSQQASYDRGSFSTLLGVQYLPSNKTLEALALGDSLAVLADGDKLISSWPYSSPERFKDRPILLATQPEHNAFMAKTGFWTMHGKHFELSELQCPRLICVTDALGEWLLTEAKADGEPLKRLLALTTEEELFDLVLEERQAGRMRVDDSTLLVTGFDMTEEPDDLPLL